MLQSHARCSRTSWTAPHITLDAHTCSRDRMTPVPGHGPLTCRRAILSVCREPMGSRTSADPRLSGPLDEESAVQPCRHPVYPPASSPLSWTRSEEAHV